jgi:hypothetical protein
MIQTAAARTYQDQLGEMWAHTIQRGQVTPGSLSSTAAGEVFLLLGLPGEAVAFLSRTGESDVVEADHNSDEPSTESPSTSESTSSSVSSSSANWPMPSSSIAPPSSSKTSRVVSASNSRLFPLGKEKKEEEEAAAADLVKGGAFLLTN